VTKGYELEKKKRKRVAQYAQTTAALEAVNETFQLNNRTKVIYTHFY